MRAFHVVFLPPVLDDHACFGQCPELLSIEALGPEPGMEALDEPILPRTPRINVERLDPGFFQPFLQLSMDKLASVVTSDVLRSSVDIHQPLELPTNIAGTDPTIHVDEMVLPGELVDDRQHLQSTAPDGAVVDEIPGPDMPSMLRLRREPRARSSPASLRFALRNPESHLTAQSLHHALADLPALILEQPGDLRVAPLAVFARNTPHRRPEAHHPRVRLQGLVAHGRTVQAEVAAGLPLGAPSFLDEALGDLPLVSRAHSFFSSASCRISIPRTWSATIFLSRAFSRSNSFSRLA